MKAYLKAKQEDRLESFFTNGFDISRYCIDARTDYLINYLNLEDQKDDPFVSCSTIDHVIHKVIDRHAVDCRNQEIKILF